jgi:transposase
MAIAMGLDQHRAQITAEWIDTDSGEIGRARISPALRGDVRRFFKRFAGQPLEVALEPTTGWRFVVEELSAIGAEVQLAEPAETAARRGNKKRAKTDRGDARHLRELLMIGRLPESWIPPDHLLDLRAKSACVTRWSIGAASGSSASRRCSITVDSIAKWAADRRELCLASGPVAS